MSCAGSGISFRVLVTARPHDGADNPGGPPTAIFVGSATIVRRIFLCGTTNRLSERFHTFRCRHVAIETCRYFVLTHLRARAYEGVFGAREGKCLGRAQIGLTHATVAK